MPPANGNPDRTVTLDPLEAGADPGEVLRYLGYPAGAVVNGAIRKRVLETVEGSLAKLRPRATYSIYHVAMQDRRRLTLAGGESFTGPIGEFLGGASRVAVFLATAGPEVVALAEDALRSRDTLGGLVYNALGAAVADVAVAHLLEDLRRGIQPGESLTLLYSPGYCGISLSQQRTLFRLVDARRVGVELLPTLIMKPVKSISGLVGIGPREAVTAFGNPCDRCPLSDCRMRR